MEAITNFRSEERPVTRIQTGDVSLFDLHILVVIICTIWINILKVQTLSTWSNYVLRIIFTLNNDFPEQH
jgi:hypothetical protein